MSILFFGAEDIDFNFVGGQESGFENHSKYAQTAYSRTSIRAITRLEARKPFSTTEAWLHFVTVIGTASMDRFTAAWGFWSPELNASHISVHTNPNYSTARFEVYNGAGTYIQSETFPIPNVAELSAWDLHVRIDGLSILIELYNNEVLVRRETFALAQTYTLRNLRLSHGSYSSSWGWHYSQVIVATEPTLGWKLKTLAPAANGDLIEFAGTYADINEVKLNNDTKISSPVSAQSSFKAASWDVPAGFDVAAVAIVPYASSDLTESKLRTLLQLNSQTFLSAENDLSPGWERLPALWSQNPETSAEWKPADINGTALQFGVGVTV